MYEEKLGSFYSDILLKLGKKISIENKEEKDKYDILTPVRISKEEVTYKLLKEKIIDKKVKNIGITGSYGSGKSSLIETIKEDDDLKTKKNISISLLNFNGNSINNEKVEEKTLELEKRILQQIFYQKTQQELPLSKFHKIEIIDKNKEYFKIVHLTIFFAVAFIIKEKYLTTIKEIIVQGELNKINLLEYLFGVFFLLWGCYFLNELVIGTKKLKIKKFSPISSIELSNDFDKEKSALDLYMEDIVYCFEHLGIEIMYIEDLDRCDNIEIFIKLREINLLLNERIKNKNITFVYAIKDELFSDKERSKFFDFIIPIIPILNSSNSEGILRSKIKFDFDEGENEFLAEIFRYITDMRLGLNICNEYKIYRNKFLKGYFSSKNLLSIIVYKNIYPEEFSKANFSTGFLYRLFNFNKMNLINNKSIKIDTEIKKMEIEIEEIKNRKIKDNKLLRAIMENSIYKLISMKGYRVIEIKSFEFENTNITVNYNYYNGSFTNDGTIKLGEKELEFISGIEYKKEKELIDKNEENIVKKLRESIDFLKKEKKELKRLSLVDLLKKEEEKEKKEILEVSEFKNNNKEKRSLEEIEYEYSLKMFLFSNGYIDETYGDYLSEFKEGEFTKEDNAFIRKVHINDESKNQKKQIIKNKEKVFEKFKTIKKYSMLNISLIDSSAKSTRDNHKIYYQKFLEFMDLKNKDIREDFLFFLREIENKEEYILGLIENKKLIWRELTEYFESKIVDEIIESVINNFSEENLEKLCELTGNQIIEDLENHENIFSLGLDLSKFNVVLKKYKIKLKKILRTNNTDFFKLLKKNKSYILTKKNIENLYFMETHSEIRAGQFYSDISKTDLIDYIYENIEIFVEEIYIELLDYSKEEEDLIIDLINNKANNEKLQFHILELNLNLFNKLELLAVNLWEFIIKNGKIIRSISNINKYYSEFGIENLIEYLTDENKKIVIDEEIDNELINEVIINENISVDIMESLLLNNSSYEYRIDKENYENIETDKIEYLIKNKKVSFNAEVIEELERTLSEKIIKKYILDNKEIVLKLIREDKLEINIFTDEIIVLLIKEYNDFEVITKNILGRQWEIKLPRDLIEEIIQVWQIKSITLLSTQVQFYNKEIFQLLEKLNSKFKNKVIYLESFNTWSRLVAELEKLNLVYRQAARKNWDLVLSKKAR